jgi:hypothetical protein
VTWFSIGKQGGVVLSPDVQAAVDQWKSLEAQDQDQDQDQVHSE